MDDTKFPLEPLVTSGFVEASGAQIYYEWTGTGYPLVLLHADGLDRRMWEEQFKTFAAAYKETFHELL